MPIMSTCPRPGAPAGCSGPSVAAWGPMRSRSEWLVSRWLLFALIVFCGGCGKRPSSLPQTGDTSVQAVPSSKYPEWLRTAIDQHRAAVPVAPRSSAVSAGLEQNVGQFDGDAKYIARFGNGVVLLRPNAITTLIAPPEPMDAPPPADPKAAAARQPVGQRRPARVDLRLPGSTQPWAPRATGLLPQTIGYFHGKDRQAWQRRVPSFERVIYEEVYPGINLAVYRMGDDIKYDFVVSPGAAPASIQMKFDGADGLTVDPSGDLVVRAAGFQLRHRKPVIYQERQGTRVMIEGGFVVNAGVVTFRIGDYDTKQPLVIDPTVVQVYSNLLGNGPFGHAKSLAVAVASDGEVFVTGWVNVFSSLTAFSKDAFVSWFSGPGGGLIFTALLSGSKTCSQMNVCDDDDIGTAIAVDAANSVYVTGLTRSIDFPTTSNAFDPNCGDDSLCGRGASLANPVKSDAFVIKLDRGPVAVNGQILVGLDLTYGSFLGGGVDDAGTGIGVDTLGTIYVTGWTMSSSFPVKNAFQNAFQGGTDAFVVALTPGGSSTTFVFGTYLGGGGTDAGSAIAVDAARALVFVAGSAASLPGTASFPATDPRGTNPGGGGTDAFVAKFTTAGRFLVATYVRGSSEDLATGIALDSSGNIYLSGTTASSNLNGAQGPTAGGTDAFVAKLHYISRVSKFINLQIAILDFVTLLGGSDEDTGNAVAVDAQDRPYLTGMTRSTNFPAAGTPQTPLRATRAQAQGVSCGTQNLACPDAYLARLTSAGGLDFVALFGGTSWDAGNGVALRASGDAVVASEDFDPNASIPHYNAFVTRIITGSDLGITKTCTPNPAHAGHVIQCTLTLTNNGPDAVSRATIVDQLSPPTWYDALTLGSAPCSTSANAQGMVDHVTCTVLNLAPNASRSITYPVIPATQGTLVNTASINYPDDWNPSNNSATANITVQANSDLNAFKAHVAEPTPLGSATNYEIWVGNQGPDLATGVQIQDQVPAGLEILSVTSPTGTCTPTQGTGPLTITCNVGSLVQPTGLAGTQAVGVQVVARATAAGMFANTATASGLVTDPTSANNTMTDNLTVKIGTPAVTVSLQPVSRTPTATGRNIQFEMKFKNNGDGNAFTVRTTQFAANAIVGTGTVTLVGGLPADIPLLETGHSQSRLPVMAVQTGVTRFQVVFQGDYQDASGNGVKIPFNGKITVVP